MKYSKLLYFFLLFSKCPMTSGALSSQDADQDFVVTAYGGDVSTKTYLTFEPSGNVEVFVNASSDGKFNGDQFVLTYHIRHKKEKFGSYKWQTPKIHLGIGKTISREYSFSLPKVFLKKGGIKSVSVSIWWAWQSASLLPMVAGDSKPVFFER